jgi:hypothetical protein
MDHLVTIYVALLDEGVAVWRPVRAESFGRDTFLLVGPVPEGELWEFEPGALVRCEPQTFSGDGGPPKTRLAAVAHADPKDVAH